MFYWAVKMYWVLDILNALLFWNCNCLHLLVSVCRTTKAMSLPSMVVSLPGSSSLKWTTWLKKSVSVLIVQSWHSFPDSYIYVEKPDSISMWHICLNQNPDSEWKNLIQVQCGFKLKTEHLWTRHMSIAVLNWLYFASLTIFSTIVSN